jgi:hypothetical protein
MSDAGLRNDNLETSTTTYIQGASWKKQRGICLLPAGKTISTRVALSWRGLNCPPNQPWHFMAIEGCEVGDAYNRAIEGILAHPDLNQWEYILTVEHDNLPPHDGLSKLIKAMDEHPEFACIGGLYWTKGEGGVPQIWGDPKDPVLNFRPQPPVPGELVECCGTGMGFNLWRLSMFKTVPKPWFVTKYGTEGTGTQDLSFWGEARKHGFRCAVDCSVLVGHLDLESGVVW